MMKRLFIAPLLLTLIIILGILGTILVFIPSLQKSLNKNPIKTWKIGLILGLIGTIIEYGLFIVIWLLEDWRVEPANINFVLFGCFVIGWLALIIGTFFVNKE